MDLDVPFYAIKHQYFDLPEGLMPWAPTFSPDGKYILFHDYNGGKEWVIKTDGSGLKCITGGMSGRPDFLGGFYYILDDKRMFLSNELGDTAVILECEPSLYAAESYRWMPIDLSDDQLAGKLCLGRRTYHMAPDGKHLAYNILRADGLIMVICTLERQPDKYVATDYYVLNPDGPASSDDRNSERWANGGTLSEFKAFCDGGRSMLFVSEGEGGSIDQYKRDLETGEVKRLTHDEDWAEDGAFSPDGESSVCASWRTMNQLNVLCQVPAGLPVFSLFIGAVVAVHYVSSYPGFANDLQPWLLSGGKYSSKRRVGQPLVTYSGGDSISANNIAGHPIWSPDSTKILIQERSLTPPPKLANERVLEKGMAPNRLCVAHLQKAPTKPLPVVESKVGSWAKRLDEYHANADFPGVHEIDGHVSGIARLRNNGNLLSCDSAVIYENFSNDGINFVNGCESISGNVNDLSWKQQFSITDKSGRLIGKTDFDLRFVKKDPQPPRDIPPMVVYGHATSTWEGITRSGLPSFGAKTANFQQPAPLLIYTELFEDRLNVYITADIYGDVRPVCGAEVSFCGECAVTREDGMVTFARPAFTQEKKVIKASAGNTFLPTCTEVYF